MRAVRFRNTCVRRLDFLRHIVSRYYINSSQTFICCVWWYGTTWYTARKSLVITGWRHTCSQSLWGNESCAPSFERQEIRWIAPSLQARKVSILNLCTLRLIVAIAFLRQTHQDLHLESVLPEVLTNLLSHYFIGYPKLADHMGPELEQATFGAFTFSTRAISYNDMQSYGFGLRARLILKSVAGTVQKLKVRRELCIGTGHWVPSHCSAC